MQEIYFFAQNRNRKYSFMNNISAKNILFCILAVQILILFDDGFSGKIRKGL